MSINVNIRDDYYIDGSVPAGKTQETIIHLVDNSLSLVFEKECIEYLASHISGLAGLGGASFVTRFYDSTTDPARTVSRLAEEPGQFQRWEIEVSNLSHADRSLLLDYLEKETLSFRGIPFNFHYSS